MKKSPLIQTVLVVSTMLFAGTSVAMGPGGQGKGGGCSTGCASGMQNAPVVALSESAAAELMKMREEEKLARDVYAELGEKWGAQVFRITKAEQKHMNAMKKMLDRFGMEDPVTDDTRGVFQTQAFTDLYHQLVEAGSASLLDALKVGAKIEELDFSDLRFAGDGVADPALTKVYANLERATRNHLRAFAKQIKANGGSYEAEFLTQEEFDTIAASPMEPSMKGQGNGQGKGQGKGQDSNAKQGCCGGCSG